MTALALDTFWGAQIEESSSMGYYGLSMSQAGIHWSGSILGLHLEDGKIGFQCVLANMTRAPMALLVTPKSTIYIIRNNDTDLSFPNVIIEEVSSLKSGYCQRQLVASSRTLVQAIDQVCSPLNVLYVW